MVLKMGSTYELFSFCSSPPRPCGVWAVHPPPTSGVPGKAVRTLWPTRCLPHRETPAGCNREAPRRPVGLPLVS